jgi:hypothetical protein
MLAMVDPARLADEIAGQISELPATSTTDVRRGTVSDIVGLVYWLLCSNKPCALALLTSAQARLAARSRW